MWSRSRWSHSALSALRSTVSVVGRTVKQLVPEEGTIMLILTATARTQGTEAGDYHHGIEGELLWVQEPCGRDRRDPSMPCGCGRGFAGVASHRGTTTALIVDSELTRDDIMLAMQTSLADGGWPVAWADEVTDHMLELASLWTAGTVIQRRLEWFRAREPYGDIPPHVGHVQA